MRVLVAGLIGGIVLFFWGFLAHMVLPIGEMGFRVASGQDAAIAAVQATATAGEGVYLLPGMAPETWRDPAARAAFTEKYRASPFAFVVYQPDGNAANSDMAPNLAKQFVSVTLVALLTAWLMALAPFPFARRVLIAAVVGLASWLAVSVPFWNWYRFPLDFTLGTLLDVGLGLVVASLPMAWWLGRSRA